MRLRFCEWIFHSFKFVIFKFLQNFITLAAKTLKYWKILHFIIKVLFQKIKYNCFYSELDLYFFKNKIIVWYFILFYIFYFLFTYFANIKYIQFSTQRDVPNISCIKKAFNNNFCKRSYLIYFHLFYNTFREFKI